MYHTKSTFFLQWFATFVKGNYNKLKLAFFLQSLFIYPNKKQKTTIN